LLDRILEKYSLKREDCYFTSVVKCATNRDPPKILEKEIRYCTPFLTKEIETVKPNIILALGPAALKAVLERTGLKKIKNTVFWSK
jgi:uracil-DNA glycosylase family 4